MKNTLRSKLVLPLSCLALVAFAPLGSAQGQRGSGPYGEWLVKGEINVVCVGALRRTYRSYATAADSRGARLAA